MATDPPIAFYSVFIAHSSRDEDFARRLHNDLQDAGIRAWLAPEHMKAGDRIRPAIHDAIRLHDIVLLILSKHSIKSQWVKDEVEAAYEEEARRGKAILFPISIDQAVQRTRKAWASKLRRQRQIGDFSQWMEEGAYEIALERVLLDLRALGPEEQEPPLSEMATLSITVDPGTAPPEDIADVLSDLSILYRKMGGSGINFSLKGIHIVEEELA